MQSRGQGQKRRKEKGLKKYHTHTHTCKHLPLKRSVDRVVGGMGAAMVDEGAGGGATELKQLFSIGIMANRSSPGPTASELPPEGAKASLGGENRGKG